MAKKPAHLTPEAIATILQEYFEFDESESERTRLIATRAEKIVNSLDIKPLVTEREFRRSLNGIEAREIIGLANESEESFALKDAAGRLHRRVRDTVKDGRSRWIDPTRKSFAPDSSAELGNDEGRQGRVSPHPGMDAENRGRKR